MVKDAESHASEDQARKKEVEIRNNADALCYSAEKTLREHGDKVGPSERAAIESAIADVRKALDGSDLSAIESATERLTQASHKLAEVLYAASAQAQQAGPQPGPEPEGPSPKTGGTGSTMDADFRVVDDEETSN